MPGIKPPSDQKTVNLKLAETIKNLPEDQQLILLKQLLKGNLTSTLFRLIGTMSDDQQSALLGQLQELPLKSVNLEETEIALRGHTRKSCMLNIDYTVEGRNFEGFMLDISPAGAFIETGEPFTAGQQIRLTFSLPNSPGQLNISGEILWKGMLGMGVKFNDMTPKQIDLIRAFMQEEYI
ncbi:MAG: PilZ domain-containing protein [Desulfobacterales bacterium]|nr:MAG: PilZ domain-containing protein [Desulfobacterales bacterium]